MEQGSRTKLVAALVLASVFGSGLLVGFAVNDATPAVAETTGEEGERRPWVPQYLEMDPTPEQLTRIEAIMALHKAEVNRLHAEYDVVQQAQQATYDALIQDTRNAIAAVFPEERRAEYRQRLEEYDRERAAERDKQSDRR